jgi:hypothetical protein
MADMAGIIGGNPAGIDPDFFRDQRNEIFFLRQGIVKAEAA